MSPQESHENDESHENPLLSCEDRLIRVGAVEPGEGRRHGTVRAAFQYIQGTQKKAGNRLFRQACSHRTRGNGSKLKDDRYRLDNR